MKTSVPTPVPPGVVTDTVPEVPLPNTTIICVPLFEVIELTGVPPTVTLAAVAPVKFVPLIVSDVPAQPDNEPKLLIVGAAPATILTQ